MTLSSGLAVPKCPLLPLKGRSAGELHLLLQSRNIQHDSNEKNVGILSDLIKKHWTNCSPDIKDWPMDILKDVACRLKIGKGHNGLKLRVQNHWVLENKSVEFLRDICSYGLVIFFHFFASKKNNFWFLFFNFFSSKKKK